MAEEENLWKRFEEQQLLDLAAEIIDEDVFDEGATPIDTDIAIIRIMLEGIDPGRVTPEQQAQILKLLQEQARRFR